MPNTDELRVLDFDDYVGQPALKRRLQVHIAEAVATGVSLQILLKGPSGYGKSTLAYLCAQGLGQEARDGLIETTLPFNPREMSRLHGFKGVLMVEELHRASRPDREDLMALMDYGYLRIKNLRRPITPEKLTIIGATTDPIKLGEPLLSRFHISPDFVDYTIDEMCEITLGMATRAGINLDTTMARAIGDAAGGVPRMAAHMVKAARALAVDAEAKDLPSPELKDLFEFCQMTMDGLTENHIRYLMVLDSQQAYGATGAELLMNILNIPRDELLGIERLLERKDYIVPTKGGRELTNEGDRRVRELKQR